MTHKFEYLFNDNKENRLRGKIYDIACELLISPEYIIRKIYSIENRGDSEICYLTSNGNLLFGMCDYMNTLMSRKIMCNKGVPLEYGVLANIVEHNFEGKNYSVVKDETDKYMKMVRQILERAIQH